MTLLAVTFHCTSSVNVEIKNASTKMLHTFVGVNKCCILSQATKCFLVQMTWHCHAHYYFLATPTSCQPASVPCSMQNKAIAEIATAGGTTQVIRFT